MAKLLFEMGQRLALAGENSYRARSYARATESLLSLTEPLDGLIVDERLHARRRLG